MILALGPADIALAALLVAASAIDVRERVLPDPLAAGIALCSACSAWADGGAGLAAANAARAVALGLAAYGVEAAWRLTGRGPGVGGGDIRLLAACAVRDPAWALASFLCALTMLAVAGTALRRASMPLIPFFTVAGAGTALWLCTG